MGDRQTNTNWLKRFISPGFNKRIAAWSFLALMTIAGIEAFAQTVRYALELRYYVEAMGSGYAPRQHVDIGSVFPAELYGFLTTLAGLTLAGYRIARAAPGSEEYDTGTSNGMPDEIPSSAMGQ